MPKTKIEIWIEQDDFFRIADLAREAKCTHSTMSRNLLHEALNEREAQAAIRQADQAKQDEIDMRFCSGHCRHLGADQNGIYCHYAESDTDNVIELLEVGDRVFRLSKCPYTAIDFARWQQYADEDAIAEARR